MAGTAWDQVGFRAWVAVAGRGSGSSRHSVGSGRFKGVGGSGSSRHSVGSGRVEGVGGSSGHSRRTS